MPRDVLVFGTAGLAPLPARLRRRFDVLRVPIDDSRRPGTFFPDLDRLRDLCGRRWTRHAFDLHVVMCALRAADRFFRSEGLFRSTRDIHIAVTVTDPRRWRALADGLRYSVAQLSSDRLEFVPVAYVRRDVEPPRRNSDDRSTAILDYRPDCVCLFSGGADSVGGVAHLLAEGRRPLLVSHAIGPISRRQQELFTALQQRFPQLAASALIQFRAFPNGPGRASGLRHIWRQRENLQRLRSMFFLALAAQMAAAYMLDDVYMCENGLIGAAIAFSPTELISHLARPAEPHYLRQVQSFFRDALNRSSLHIRNPFQYLTKGEMLARTASLGLGDLMHRTVSCWRRGNSGIWNCGECVPCLFRQLAFDEAGLPTRPSDYRGHTIPRRRWRRWQSDEKHRLVALREYCETIEREGRAWLFSNEPAVADAIDVTGGPAGRPAVDPTAQAVLDEEASARMADTISRFARATLQRLQ